VVESQPSKLLVAGSIPVSRSRNAGIRDQWSDDPADGRAVEATAKRLKADG
jgi:hypothetical protein